MKQADFKKLGLDYDILDKEFDLEQISSLRDLLDKMFSKTSSYIGLLEDIMQPDSISTMHEANFLRTHKFSKIQELYKELMKLNRDILLVKLDYSKENVLNLINQFLISWTKIKPDLIILVKEMRDSWNKTVIHKQDGGYFG
ncbi:MAG: hypothetical protein ACMXX9_00360 [Candidatus Woesearchaeota archaeon]